MAKAVNILLAAGDGLSGNSVRGVADNAAQDGSAQAVAEATGTHLEETVRHAADLIRDGLNLAGKAFGEAVDVASNEAFQSAANVGKNIADNSRAIGESAFSWSGYFQAIGALCLLLGALWFAVWLMRRSGKFNFMPRPGAFPRDALVMEAQLPLGPRKGLMVVRFLNRRLLLGVTDQRISLLTEERAGNERRESTFQEIMDKAGGAGSDSDPDSRPGA